MSNDLHLLASDLSGLSQALAGPDVLRPAFVAVGDMAKKAAPAAASGDLGGDAVFSGWKRAGALAVRYTLHSDGRGVTIHRERKSAGPWRVAESGRNPQRAFQGPSINQRTGTTSRTKKGRIAARRPGRARRWNGVTAGKGSWGKAEAAVVAQAGPLFEQELLSNLGKKWS